MGRSPRMGRGIQGQQHQEHGQQAAGRGVDHLQGTIRCPRIRRIGEFQVYGKPPADAVRAILEDVFSPPPARISGSGRDQPTMGVHKQNTVSLRTS